MSGQGDQGDQGDQKRLMEERWQARGVARPKHAARWSQNEDDVLQSHRGKPIKPDDPGKTAQKKRLEYK